MKTAESLNAGTSLDRVLVTGTVLVMPLLAGGAACCVWAVAGKLKSWGTLPGSKPLERPDQMLAIINGTGAAALLLLVAGILGMRMLWRQRVLAGRAAAAPNPYTPRSKYAVWNFRRHTRSQALFGALRARKKIRL